MTSPFLKHQDQNFNTWLEQQFCSLYFSGVWGVINQGPFICHTSGPIDKLQNPHKVPNSPTCSGTSTNEPLYNEVLGITNDIFQPGHLQ